MFFDLQLIFFTPRHIFVLFLSFFGYKQTKCVYSGRGGKKKKHKKSRREERNLPSPHGVVDPEAPPTRRGEYPVGAALPPDTRYADMAPK